MSADNGWVLRRNARGKFVLQMYFASEDTYPEIDDHKAQVFDTLEEAVNWFETKAGYSEYGLTTQVQALTYGKMEKKVRE